MFKESNNPYPKNTGESQYSDELLNKDSIKKNVAKMEFEEAFAKLQTISKKLDSGEISLSQTIKYLEYATILKFHCKKILDQFRLKVQEITNLDIEQSGAEKK